MIFDLKPTAEFACLVKVECQTGLSKDPGQFPVFPGLRSMSTFPGHLASMHYIQHCLQATSTYVDAQYYFEINTSIFQ